MAPQPDPRHPDASSAPTAADPAEPTQHTMRITRMPPAREHPATTGPATTGPLVTGPATTGPATALVSDYEGADSYSAEYGASDRGEPNTNPEEEMLPTAAAQVNLQDLLAETTSATVAAPATRASGPGPAAQRGAEGAARVSESLPRRITTGRSRARVRAAAPRETRRIAEGMVEMPYIPLIDPEKALLSEAEILAVMSRGTGDSRAPELQAGSWVADQYEIKGCLAHGGMGWIYLAVDHNVSARWVVLKGLLDAAHQESIAVAAAEREVLAEVSHPAIVQIYNFIVDDAATAIPLTREARGYIVMEYVGGPSLNDIRRATTKRVLDVDIAIGYILELLPAMSYFHSLGLVYNDLKPENIMAVEDHIKLIDLGAVSGVGDYGHIYGTPGFQAPEIVSTGPTVSTDLYTVGRTLAALIVRLPTAGGRYRDGIPTPDEEPLFRKYDSLYRWLLRATHPDPVLRFRSAEGMAGQLIGVLREILAIRDGQRYPLLSPKFSPQRSTFGTTHSVQRTDILIDGIARDPRIVGNEVAAALPVPLMDPTDPGSKVVSAAAYTAVEDRIDTFTSYLERTTTADSPGIEVPLALARAYIDTGDPRTALDILDALTDRHRGDWRYEWHRGVCCLLLNRPHDAYRNFEIVRNAMPGETGPKLALAATAELLQGIPGENHRFWHQQAQRFYSVVWATDRSVASAAFGLARQLQVEGQCDDAVTVLDEVPSNSRHNPMARMTSILMLINGRPLDHLRESHLREAARRLRDLPPEERRIIPLTVAVLGVALTWLEQQPSKPTGELIHAVPFTQRGLRTGMESAFRLLARSAASRRHRYSLVDMANAVRPYTRF